MSSRSANRLRIIGGKWRGRKIEFPDREGLRPTGDRIRETLFNWLAPTIAGARCLDLFAGSGALGFEALSRGAIQVVMVESDLQAANTLHTQAQILDPAAALEIVSGAALTYLQRKPQPFDIIFLDPPFAANLWEPLIDKLQLGWLRSGGWIYMECAKGVVPSLPQQWRMHRSKSSGEVGYHLARAALE